MICHCNTVDFKTKSLCDDCGNSEICKYREQFETVRTKLIELTSPTTDIIPDVDPSFNDPKIYTTKQDNPPEVDLSNGIYLHMTCGHYQPCVRFRPDPIISPFKPQ